jgi:hypothetical protein
MKYFIIDGEGDIDNFMQLLFEVNSAIGRGIKVGSLLFKNYTADWLVENGKIKLTVSERI